MLNALLDVVLPVLVVAAIGAIVGRTLRPELSSVTKISLYALTPALTLDTLAHTRVPASAALVVVAGYALWVAVMAGIAWWSSRGAEPLARRAQVVAVIIGNNGNMGLPVALFALGEAGFDRALIVFLASVFFTFTLGPAILSPGGWRASARAVLRLPLVWAAAAGLALNLLGWTLPTGVDRGVHLLAQATVPTVLPALGLQIGSSGLPRLTPFVVRTSALRLLVGPLVGVMTARAVGARGLEFEALVLASAMPTAVNAFLLASELGADARSVAGTVITTTFGSLLTIAIVVASLPHLAR